MGQLLLSFWLAEHTRIFGWGVEELMSVGTKKLPDTLAKPRLPSHGKLKLWHL